MTSISLRRYHLRLHWVNPMFEIVRIIMSGDKVSNALWVVILVVLWSQTVTLGTYRARNQLIYLLSPILYTFLAVTKPPTHSGTKLPDKFFGCSSP
jgi:hypothetical protein